MAQGCGGKRSVRDWSRCEVCISAAELSRISMDCLLPTGNTPWRRVDDRRARSAHRRVEERVLNQVPRAVLRSQEAEQQRTEVRIARGERDALQGSVRASEAESERRRKAADAESAELVEARSRIAELEVGGCWGVRDDDTWTSASPFVELGYVRAAAGAQERSRRSRTEVRSHARRFSVF
jgi:hypothetical protein